KPDCDQTSNIPLEKRHSLQTERPHRKNRKENKMQHPHRKMGGVTRRAKAQTATHWKYGMICCQLRRNDLIAASATMWEAVRRRKREFERGNSQGRFLTPNLRCTTPDVCKRRAAHRNRWARS